MVKLLLKSYHVFVDNIVKRKYRVCFSFQTYKIDIELYHRIETFVDQNYCSEIYVPREINIALEIAKD